MADTKQFLERFNRWKNGAPIQELYKAGRPVTFDDGKDVNKKPEEDPALRAALEYALALKLDKYDEGKDVAGSYNFNAIQKVALNAPLSYGSYYDLTGDVNMDNMLPKYDIGKNKKRSAFLESISGKNRQIVNDTIDYFLSANVDPMLIAGIVGNMSQESRFDPNAVGPGGFSGTVLMSSDMAKEIRRAYGKVDFMTTNRFIHDAMSGDNKISKAWRSYMKLHGGYYGNTYATPQAAAMAFGKVFERPNEKYANWNQRGVSASDAYNYILERSKNQSYDMKRAVDLGYERDPKNGHMGSRDYKTGRILKKATHPTYGMALIEDAFMGYYPETRNGETYTNTWTGNNFLPSIIQTWSNMQEHGQPLILRPQ